MAFQTGTKVDPRLMRADLSGFSRGTELAMAGIASAVSGYAKKKKEKEQNKLAAEAFVGAAENNPYLRGLFPEGELTTESVLPTVKAMGAKNMMSLMMQTNLLQTKGDIEGTSLKRQKQDLEGLGKLLKTQGIIDAGGYLEFELQQDKAFTTGEKKRFGLEDTRTDPRLATLNETYGPLLQAMYPEQFGGVSASASTYTEPSKIRDNVGVDYSGFSIVK
jgi:hypothetical protein